MVFCSAELRVSEFLSIAEVSLQSPFGHEAACELPNLSANPSSLFGFTQTVF